jgi:hypothetical protein
VQSVHRRGKTWHADVERAQDFRSQRIDLRRRTWKKVVR